MIENAVDPMNFEPNLALDLEISDLINSKKGNAWVQYPIMVLRKADCQLGLERLLLPSSTTSTIEIQTSQCSLSRYAGPDSVLKLLLSWT